MLANATMGSETTLAAPGDAPPEDDQAAVDTWKIGLAVGAFLLVSGVTISTILYRRSRKTNISVEEGGAYEVPMTLNPLYKGNGSTQPSSTGNYSLFAELATARAETTTDPSAYELPVTNNPEHHSDEEPEYGEPRYALFRAAGTKIKEDSRSEYALFRAAGTKIKEDSPTEYALFRAPAK
jgi:hypothetical protein